MEQLWRRTHPPLPPHTHSYAHSHDAPSLFVESRASDTPSFDSSGAVNGEVETGATHSFHCKSQTTKQNNNNNRFDPYGRPLPGQKKQRRTVQTCLNKKNYIYIYIRDKTLTPHTTVFVRATFFFFFMPSQRSTPAPSPAAFAKWAKQHEIFIHPDVDVLHATPQMGGCGVVARRALPTGTVVLSTPLTASIHPYAEPHPRIPSIAVLQAAGTAQLPHDTNNNSACTQQQQQHTADAPLHADPATLPHRSSFGPNTTTAVGSPLADANPNALHAQKKGRHNCAPPLTRRDPVLCVVLRLMAEYCKGSRSTCFPWLQHCPPMSAHLFDLRPQEQAALGQIVRAPGPQADHHPGASGHACCPAEDTASSRVCCWFARWTSISQQLRELRVAERWAVAQEEAIGPHPDIWPPAKATYALFCRCLAHVFSRNFHREEIVGREGPYLLPGLDFLNHASPPNTAFEVRGGGRKHGMTFTVLTTEPIKAGQQIFASYGSIGAARFTVEFQFLSEDAVRADLCRYSCEQLAEMAAYLLMPVAQQQSCGGAPHQERGGEPSCACAEGERRPSGPTADVVQAAQKEMSRRVEVLQRLGLLFDEGLYLRGAGDFTNTLSDGSHVVEESTLESAFRAAVQPHGPLPWYPTIPGSASTPTTTNSSKSAPTSPYWSEAVQNKAWSNFGAVCFLLALPTRSAFDAYYHHTASAHWEAPKTPAGLAAVVAFLLIKLHAVRRTWWAGVTPAFLGSETTLKKKREEEENANEREEPALEETGRTTDSPQPDSQQPQQTADDAAAPRQPPHQNERAELLHNALKSEEGVLLRHLAKLLAGKSKAWPGSEALPLAPLSGSTEVRGGPSSQGNSGGGAAAPLNALLYIPPPPPYFDLTRRRISGREEAILFLLKLFLCRNRRESERRRRNVRRLLPSTRRSCGMNRAREILSRTVEGNNNYWESKQQQQQQQLKQNKNREAAYASRGTHVIYIYMQREREKERERDAAAYLFNISDDSVLNYHLYLFYLMDNPIYIYIYIYMLLPPLCSSRAAPPSTTNSSTNNENTTSSCPSLQGKFWLLSSSNLNNNHFFCLDNFVERFCTIPCLPSTHTVQRIRNLAGLALTYIIIAFTGSTPQPHLFSLDIVVLISGFVHIHQHQLSSFPSLNIYLLESRLCAPPLPPGLPLSAHLIPDTISPQTILVCCFPSFWFTFWF
eukprot:gene10972-7617_t